MQARRTTPVAVAAVTIALLGAGCGSTPVRPRAPEQAHASPLGPSYVLLPLPGDDDSLLGRVLPELPQPGRSLEETARPNPCADKLAPAKTTQLANTFEDAEDISVSAKAKAMLGTFGFEADASKASHFFYKMSTERRAARTDTTEYVKCCEETKGCGVGFVSALVYGDGEYATGEETSAEAGVQVAVAGGSGSVKLKVLHRRKVHGYLAALVTLTAPSGQQGALGPLGVADLEPTMPERVRMIYEMEKVSIEEHGDRWALRAGAQYLSENEFARRYEKTTGSQELRPIDTRRNTVGLVIMGAFAAASIYGTYWGATNLKKDCTADDVSCTHVPSGNTAPQGTICTRFSSSGCSEYYDPTERKQNVSGVLALTLISPVALTTTGMFIYMLVDKDGGPMSHDLEIDDARAFAARYNRALLKKTRQKVERELAIERGATLELTPLLAPGFVGLGGRF